MSNRLLPYGSVEGSLLVSKVGNQKSAGAGLMIYGSDRNSSLIAKEGTAKTPQAASEAGQKRVVRLNARK